MEEGEARPGQSRQNLCSKPPAPPPPGISKQQDERLRRLKKQAELLSLRMQTQGLTDVQALALMFDFAARLYGNNKYGALRDLGIVIGGLDTTRVIPRQIDENNPDDPMHQYYVGYSTFVPKQTGFSSELNPNNDNQVRHFLAGAAGANTFPGIINREIMYGRETAPEDQALYSKSFAFVDWLYGSPSFPNSGHSLSEASDWVLENLTP